MGYWSQLRRLAFCSFLGLAALGVAKPSKASKFRGIKATLAPKRIAIDGLPNEWTGAWHELSVPLRGSVASSSDLKASATVQYDARYLYVAADVNDDRVVVGGDHVELVIGIPGGRLASLKVFPGVPGKSRARVKLGYKALRRVRVVEAMRPGGYTIEARIPWSVLPQSKRVRIGLRGALVVHDADRSKRPSKALATTGKLTYAKLPPLSLEPELALGAGLLRDNNIQTKPRYNLLADVLGDSMLERILVYDRYLVVLGPSYRQGRGYFFRELKSSAERGDVLDLQLRDCTGDAKADIVIRQRIRGTKGTLKMFQILSYHAGSDTPQRIFAQEYALDVSATRVRNKLRMHGAGGGTTIAVQAGPLPSGFDPSRVFESRSYTGANAILLPWGEIAEQRYVFKGDRFQMVDERLQPKKTAGAPAAVSGDIGKTQAPKSVGASSTPRTALGSVYALYKKKSGATGQARFDLRGNLAGGPQKERCVVHGRDLVVFGAGYLGGRGYAAVQLPFQSPSDILRATLRDLSGDGRSEVLVRGKLKREVKMAGETKTLTRVAAMAFKVVGTTLRQVFAAELSRAIGSRRVNARIDFPTTGPFRIRLRPGRAVGFDEHNYPWLQKENASAGVEPLLLPWGGIKQIRLRFDGSRFVR